jgi:hypothetical protein
VSPAEQVPVFIRLRVALPIHRLGLYILPLKVTNFTFCQLYPEYKIKLFPAISIFVMDLNPLDHRAAALTGCVGSEVEEASSETIARLGIKFFFRWFCFTLQM